MTKRRAQIEREIEKIKSQLEEFQVMRPGSLTTQYKNREKQSGAFYQLSYTHHMKSKTEYIRAEFVKQVRRQIRDYKRFRKLVDQWIALGIEYSQLTMKLEKERQAATKRKAATGRQRSNK